MTKNKVILILTLLVIVAFSIRITAIFNWDSYLFDEQISVSIAQKPLEQMWSYLRWEMHPPLHYYYLHGWIKAFGASEISGRVSSLVLGLLSIIAIYFLGKEIFKSKKTGLYASFLVAISSFQSFYSIWTRMYMLFFLFSILSFYFLLKALRQDKTKDWILTGLFVLLALYSHLTTLAIPAIMLVFVLYLKFKNEITTQQVKRFAMMLGINFLLFLPWLYSFITLRLQSFSSRAWYFWAQGYDLFFINVPIRFMIAGNTVALVETAALALFGTLFLSAVFKWQKSTPGSWQITSRITSGHVLSLLIMLIPLIAVYAINLNALRLYMLPAIGVYLLFGYGLAQIDLGKYKKWLLIAIIAIVSVPLSEVIKLPEVGWEKMTQFIQEREQPGDKIINAVYGQLMMIDFYYQGNLEADAVIDDELRQDDRLLTILKTNFFPPVTANNVEQLAGLTQGHERIFFVFSDHLFGDAQDVAVEWFVANGWQLEEKLNIGGFTAPQVWLLSKTR
jgi:mannosyltransferase